MGTLFRPLTIECVLPVLRVEHGNVTECARALGVNSLQLRRFIRNTPELAAEIIEAREQVADKAEQVVFESLYDASSHIRDDASRFVLSTIAKDRGLSRSAAVLTLPATGGTLEICWLGQLGPNFSTDEGENNASPAEQSR